MKRLLILSITLLMSGLAHAAPGNTNLSNNVINIETTCKMPDGTIITKSKDSNLLFNCKADTGKLIIIEATANAAGDLVRMAGAEKIAFTPVGKITKETAITLNVPAVGKFTGFYAQATTGVNKKPVYYIVRTEKLSDGTYMIKFYRSTRKPTATTMWEEMWTTTTEDIEQLKKDIKQLESEGKGVSIMPDGTLSIRFFNLDNDNAIALPLK